MQWTSYLNYISATMIKHHLSLIIAGVIWGTSFMATKLLLGSIPPITIAFIRFLLASSCLLFFIIFIKKEKINLFFLDTFQLLLLGLFGITIYYCAENVSLIYISTSSASLILALIPAATMILSTIFLKEKNRLVNWFGAVIALLGACQIVLKDCNIYELDSLNVGYIYIFIAMISFSLYTVIGKKLLVSRSPVQITAFTFFYGTILLIPLMILESMGSTYINISISTLGNILYLTLVCSIGGYYFWNWGLSGVDSGKASIYINVIPLTAVILGVIVLKEEMTTELISGGVLILSGIYLTNKK
ncbi:MAG: hypothetical protein CVU61_00920 [Deltaproteobacteria bacterium HGW-Deltaproteobacteria-19]|nr:MAG: hypothetical protein CVU61_00920 [Deltaproteobacteria bacterium HGW-Deltaproteobacteria-19]